jgi:hypothetical protein
MRGVFLAIIAAILALTAVIWWVQPPMDTDSGLRPFPGLPAASMPTDGLSPGVRLHWNDDTGHVEWR